MAGKRKYLVHIMAAVITTVLFSCGDDYEKKMEEEVVFETLESERPVASFFSPFKIIMVKHNVSDFEKWKTGYLKNDSMRTAFGISDFQIGRGLDNLKTVVVIDKITDVQKAKDFSKLPDLRRVMQKAGVTGSASFSYAEVIRHDDTNIEQKERVMITHRVKDFDAWLKAYDAEGVAKRMENGMLDWGLARNTDDPNMVYIFFAIADIEKAKARINSSEIKKIMADAGVAGTPQVFYYKLED